MLAAIVMFPLVYRPKLGIVLVLAVALVALAYRSVAWPLGLAGLPVVLAALVGHSVLPAKGPTVGFAAWTLLAVGLVAFREGAPTSRVWLTGAAVGSALLAVLWIAREGASADPAYASLKVQLFVVLNLVSLVGGVLVGRNARAVRLLTTLWILLATVTSITLAQGLSSGAADTAVGGRISLDARNGPISLGRDAATGILIAISFLLTARSRGRQVLAFATLPVISIAFIASGSRGPVLGLIVGLAVLLALTLRERQARIRIVLVVAGAVLGAILVTQLVPGQDVSRALSVLTGSAGSNGRADIWGAAWNVFRAHPLLGVGTGSFAVYRPPELYPHNLFLEVGAELGVVGLLVLAAVLVSGARSAWRAYAAASPDDRPQTALVAALLAATFVNAQFSGDITTNSDLWLLIGLALGLRERAAVSATATDVVHRVRAWRREGVMRAPRRPASAGSRPTPWLQGSASRRERSPGEIVVPREGAVVGGVVDVAGRPAETGWGVASVQLELSADGGSTWSPISHGAGVAYDVFRIVDGFKEHVAAARTHRVAELLAAELARGDEATDRYVVEPAARRPWQLGAGWSIEWDASALAPGEYALRAVTRDIAGGRVASPVRSVSVVVAPAVRAPDEPDPRDLELRSLRTELEAQARMLATRQSELADREQALQSRLAALPERERSLAAREAELAALAAALEARERAAESQADERAADAGERERALASREAELRARERDLEGTRAELVTRERSLAERVEAVQRRERELFRRAAAVGRREEAPQPPADAPPVVEREPEPPVVVAQPPPIVERRPLVRPPAAAPAHRGLLLETLERAVHDRPADDPYVQAEREATLFALRGFVHVDDRIPPQFHAMVNDVFGDLL